MLLSRRALRFAVVATSLCALCTLGSLCGTDHQELWFCLNPATGKLDGAPYDANHVVNGVFDPCHCYDPCGPQKSCPIIVDAGPLPPGCDGGDGGLIDGSGA
jgi:hypothetical protein